IRSQITGKLQEVHFKEGQTIKKGDLLFAIDPRPLQAALDQAKANLARDAAQLENAQLHFEREKELLDSKLVSQEEFDNARAVPERYLPEIRRELSRKPLKVEASFTGMTAAPPQGELTFVDNTVDTTTGTIQLKATFANEDNVLWPGQFVQTLLTLSELPNAVVVPAQAVQTGQNGQYVYVVDKEDQTVEQRPVTIGVGYNGETVVPSGLRAGEIVVTDGQLRLAPKLKVSFKSAGQSENSK